MTEIIAPSQTVWEILAEVPRYPEWNPFIDEVHGELRNGAEIQLKRRFPDSSEMQTNHNVCAPEPAWELSRDHINIPLSM